MDRSEQPIALYEKIKKSVVKDIESGKLNPDDKVLSETRLAKKFNASRMTANRALKELTEEGRRKGKRKRYEVGGVIILIFYYLNQ